jgi:hypothetical protein
VKILIADSLIITSISISSRTLAVPLKEEVFVEVVGQALILELIALTHQQGTRITLKSYRVCLQVFRRSTIMDMDSRDTHLLLSLLKSSMLLNSIKLRAGQTTQEL